MTKVAVYRFRLYDIVNDQMVLSLRWATREAIESISAEILEGEAVEVDPSILDGNGMTERGFNSHPRSGFQTSIRP